MPRESQIARMLWITVPDLSKTRPTRRQNWILCAKPSENFSFQFHLLSDGIAIDKCVIHTVA